MDGWAKNLDSGERDDDWNDASYFHSYETKAGRDYALKAGEEQQFETGEPVVMDDDGGEEPKPLGENPTDAEIMAATENLMLKASAGLII